MARKGRIHWGWVVLICFLLIIITAVVVLSLIQISYQRGYDTTTQELTEIEYKNCDNIDGCVCSSYNLLGVCDTCACLKEIATREYRTEYCSALKYYLGGGCY